MYSSSMVSIKIGDKLTEPFTSSLGGRSILWLFILKFLVIILPDLLKIITLVLLMLIFMHQSLQYFEMCFEIVCQNNLKAV
jgi:hypothetical protein